jgi:hypothetical protein
VRPITLDDCLRLDVRYLARNGYLEQGSRKAMGWKVQGEFCGSAFVTAGASAIDVVGDKGQTGRVGDSIEIERTPCTYGGARPWFQCPECSRRCAVLFLNQNFVCRMCRGVLYLTDVLSKSKRLQSRREQAARHLGLDLATGEIVTPRYMHGGRWARYWRQYEAAQAAILAETRSWADCRQ